MGLDLVLYKRTKDIHDMSIEEELESELAYGRKTWAIANFFMENVEITDGSEYNFRISEEDWNTFYKAIEPYFKNDDFRDFVLNYRNWEDETGDLYNVIEYTMDRIFNEGSSYYLGADWEAHAVALWYEADAAVREAFKEGEVWLMVSW